MSAAPWPIPGQESNQVRRAQCCTQELAALVQHALFDDPVRPRQHRRRNGEAEGLGGLEVDDQLEFSRHCYWRQSHSLKAQGERV